MISLFVRVSFCSLTLFFKQASSASEDVCYDKLGCFSQKDPWVSADRPFPPPEDPTKINVSATFFSRENTEGSNVLLYPDIVFDATGYSTKRRTVTITHGFASSSESQWVHDMKTAYLKNMDANVFLINWKNGANNNVYFQAAANTRVAGAVLGRFGNYLVKKGTKLDKFHMIGHSLGAHTTGYAAAAMNKESKDKKKVFKITGLDPAQPGFQNISQIVRLSKNKAVFVDIVHSDAKPFIPLMGFGYLTNLGHVDFYLNQGFEQPECKDSKPISNLKSIDQLSDVTVEVISKAVSCSHGRSYMVYTSSIDPDVKCKFIGHRVITENPITSDQKSCGKDNQNCIKMGLDTQKFKPRGAFQVMTSGEKPYCCYNYSPVTGCSATKGGGTGIAG